MSEKNQQNLLPLVAITGSLMVTALLITAGCLLPASKATPAPVPSTCSSEAGVCTVPVSPSVRIEAAPQVYSPFMSSTPGIGLVPNVTGFNPADAEFTWNASYGHFLDWSPPDYTVNSLSQPVVNHGEKVYWSFTDAPETTSDPVIISVTARDLRSGQIVGSSYLLLEWEGNFTVTVNKTV